MPKRPYIPDGALRDVLAYPASPRRFTNQEFGAALTRMGLSYLSSWLDRVARWDKELTEPEQQGLAFERVCSTSRIGLLSTRRLHFVIGKRADSLRHFRK
jgi:ABC-type uncharacterized transport system fused permease/ATPase subunit